MNIYEELLEKEHILVQTYVFLTKIYWREGLVFKKEPP